MTRTIVLVMLLSCTIVLLGAAQPASRVDAFADRLVLLSPSDPDAYFLLGEEVAAEAASDRDLGELATHLYVVAFELDRRRPAPRLGASVCLGLADLARVERDRNWLIALARTIDRRYATPDWSGGTSAPVSDEIAYRAATALSLVRAGRGPEARRLLEDPQVRSLLVRNERLMHPRALTGMFDRVERDAGLWPCPECGNERVTTTRINDSVQTSRCNTCLGDPGPDYGMDTLIAQLRFEQWLLEGVNRSWSAQMMTDGGLPLRDPDADELAPTLDVDPTLVYWRDGAWVAAPDGD